MVQRRKRKVVQIGRGYNFFFFFPLNLVFLGECVGGKIVSQGCSIGRKGDEPA